MLCNNYYIPQLFLQKIPCRLLSYEEALDHIKYLSFSIGYPQPYCAMLKQIHSAEVLTASLLSQDGDGHIFGGTKAEARSLAYQKLGIQTADCLAISFHYSDAEHIISCLIHAGWRGLTGGIIANAMQKILACAIRLKIAPKLILANLQVVIGPAIFGISYECGADVQQALQGYKDKNFTNTADDLFAVCANIAKDIALASHISYRTCKDKIFPDLQLLASLECIDLGILVENIIIIRTNTYNHPQLPSFREYNCIGKNKNRLRLWTHLNL